MINSEFTAQSEEDIVAMQLFNYCSPPLLSGTYTIQTEQKVVWTKQSVDETYTGSQEFLVDGPRFSIDPAEVYSIYPAANSQGQFETILPHVVLRKPTLPWERTIDDQPPEEPPVPWMALLLLTEEEVGGLENTTVGQIVDPSAESSTFGPQNLTHVTDEEKLQPAILVRIPRETFGKIIPAKDELPYLAHCREVDMANKELRTDVSEGFFSVAVANRFPRGGKKHIACLVSLEGFSDYLYGGSAVPGTYDFVGMAVLATWRFEALDARGETFGDLVQNLDVCSLHLQNAPATVSTEEEQLVANAFHDGYVAMNYLMNTGERTAAWYRGPLPPVILNNTILAPFLSSEAAMIYDQATGLFDLSYATAWQIGRLLALSSTEFATGLINWVKQQKLLQIQKVEQGFAIQRLQPLLTRDASAFEGKFQRRAIRQALHGYLKYDFSRAIQPGMGKTGLIAQADPNNLQDSKSPLPGLLSREQLLEALKNPVDLRRGIREVLNLTTK